ncbi:MAG: hypothetical protein K6F35_11910 [Lachnospiraceae bacterium]|nr:hypothetical protein [Lachnospiraceae bacterium]
MRDLEKIKIKMDCGFKLEYAPYFKLEGRGSFSSERSMDRERFDPEFGLYVIMTCTFHLLVQGEDGEILENEFAIPVNTVSTPEEMMDKAAYLSLKRFLGFVYSDWEGDLEKYDQFFMNTVALTNYHTFRRIKLSGWLDHHTDRECEIRVWGDDGREYMIKDGELLDFSGRKLCEVDVTRLSRGKKKKDDELYYDEYHRVHAGVVNIRDYLEAIGSIPDFFERHNTEDWQFKEAVKRLRFLGVSEKEIEDFENSGIIPRVTQNRDESISRNDYEEYERKWFARDWRMELTGVLKALRGGIPYLHFKSTGAIPMDAYLYVEYMEEEHALYSNELKEGEKTLVLSAIVFSGYDDYEFGSIEVELTGDGPVRIG